MKEQLGTDVIYTPVEPPVPRGFPKPAAPVPLGSYGSDAVKTAADLSNGSYAASASVVRVEIVEPVSREVVPIHEIWFAVRIDGLLNDHFREQRLSLCLLSEVRDASCPRWQDSQTCL